MKKRALHLFLHIVFALAATIFAITNLLNVVHFNTYKNMYETSLSSKDAGIKFKDSEIFNQMLGAAVFDAISYTGISDIIENLDEDSVDSVKKDINDANSTVYREYSKYNDYFSNSNIRFFVIENSKDNVFCNTNINNQDLDKETLKKSVKELCDRYIYLDAKNHVFETNTLIEENTVYKLFENSDYEFPIDTVIMVGCLKNLNSIHDDFYNTSRAYSFYVDNYYIKLIVMCVSLFLYVLIILSLSAIEGVKINKETNVKSFVLKPIDSIPIELLLLVLLPVFLVAVIVKGYFSDISAVLSGLVIENSLLALFLIGIVALIVSISISVFYFSLVRRIKCKTLLKSSLVVSLIKRIGTLSSYIFMDMGVILKVIIPLLIIMVSNTAITYLVVEKHINVLIIVLILIDLIAFYLYYINQKEREGIIKTIDDICNGDLKAKIDTEKVHGDNIKLANAVNNIGLSVNEAVAVSMKDEKMKADLITNVSHDLKTPLTSIINYVDLLKKEPIENRKAVNYIHVLDEKSQRLKALTDALVEASKISSGNLVLNIAKINVKELLSMASAEFIDKFEERGLSIVARAEEGDVFINADSKNIYRVLENLFTNIYKYALQNTRVYLDVFKDSDKAYIQIKNISLSPINVSPEELLERFVRGDEARTSEGSGLGLSIAKNLTEAMGGEFEIYIDGDLFKVSISFPAI